MTKMLKLISLSALALTVAGCGKKVLVPEKTVAAVYVDFKKAYQNGRGIYEAIIDVLPSSEREAITSEYKKAIDIIDRFKNDLSTEWIVIATFGGNLADLSNPQKDNFAAVFKVEADEGDVTKLLKAIDGGETDIKIDRIRDDVFYQVGEGRFGLLQGKYLICSPSKDAFNDMVDLYLGKDKPSSEFDDLPSISGDTMCRLTTVSVSKLLEWSGMRREIEKFGKTCGGEELANLVLKMGAITLDIGAGDQLSLSLHACGNGGKNSEISLNAAFPVLAAVAVPAFMSYFGDTRVAQTRALIKNIEDACQMYNMKHGGKYPRQLSDLLKGDDDNPPLLDGSLEDPWGNEIKYERKGKRIILTSFGPDGEEGTEDDITNSKKSK